MNSQRIIWIDWGKAICMFLVILGHCHLRDEEITKYIYSFHMPFFFFVSGILCKNSISKETIIKDIKLLIIPYLTYGIITIIFHSALNKEQTFEDTLITFQHLLFGNYYEDGPIWFLLALFFCKQLFHIFQITKNFSSIYYTLIISSFFYIQVISIGAIKLPYHIDSALSGFPFFILGNLLKNIPNLINQLNKRFRLLLLTFLIVFTSFSSLNNGSIVMVNCMYGNNLLLYYLNAFLGIILIILIGGFLKENKLINLLSRGTIVTLGIHGHILLVLHYYLPKTFDYYSTTYSLGLGLIYSFIAQIFCIFLMQLIKRLPYTFIWGLRNN